MCSKDVGSNVLHFSSVSLARFSSSLSSSVLGYNMVITIPTLEVLLGFSMILSIYEVPRTIDINVCCCDRWNLDEKGMVEEDVQGITRASL